MRIGDPLCEAMKLSLNSGTAECKGFRREDFKKGKSLAEPAGGADPGPEGPGINSEGGSLFEMPFFLQKGAPLRGLLNIAHPDRFRNPIRKGIFLSIGAGFFPMILEKIFHRLFYPGKEED